MKKKLVAVLSGAALVLALSGCNDSQDELAAWARTVCDEASVQTDKINSANTTLTKIDSAGEPVDVRKADSTAFQQISSAYKSLAGIVSKAGAPPVENGEQLHKKAVADLNGLSASYAALKKQVDGIDTADQAEFADGLKGVSDELGKISKEGENALDTLREGEVGQAMAEQPGCRKAAESSSAAPTGS